MVLQSGARISQLDEARWHIAAVEARIMLEMRSRANGGPIDDAKMCRMFDELEEAVDRLRMLEANAPT